MERLTILAPGFAVGGKPTLEDALAYDVVVNLSETEDRFEGVIEVWLPQRDGERPLPEVGLTVAKLLIDGKSVLLHCREGVCRSILGAADALERLGTPYELALHHVRNRRFESGPGISTVSSRVAATRRRGVAHGMIRYAKNIHATKVDIAARSVVLYTHGRHADSRYEDPGWLYGRAGLRGVRVRFRSDQR